MRLSLGIVLLLFCIFIGYCLSGKYYLRRVFYSDFYNFNTYFVQEIAFRQSTLIDIINAKDSNTNFYQLLSNYVINGNCDLSNNYLTGDEKNFINEYLEKIGKFDKNTQLEYLKSVENIILEKQKCSVLDEKKYKSLYIKLSFLVGLILMVIVL